MWYTVDGLVYLRLEIFVLLVEDVGVQAKMMAEKFRFYAEFIALDRLRPVWIVDRGDERHARPLVAGRIRGVYHRIGREVILRGSSIGEIRIGRRPIWGDGGLPGGNEVVSCRYIRSRNNVPDLRRIIIVGDPASGDEIELLVEGELHLPESRLAPIVVAKGSQVVAGRSVCGSGKYQERIGWQGSADFAQLQLSRLQLQIVVIQARNVLQETACRRSQTKFLAEFMRLQILYIDGQEQRLGHEIQRIIVVVAVIPEGGDGCQGLAAD